MSINHNKEDLLVVQVAGNLVTLRACLLSDISLWLHMKN